MTRSKDSAEWGAYEPKKLSAKGLKFGIVVSRYHPMIGQRLLDGALRYLEEKGGRQKEIKTFFVPGAFEIPLMLKALAESEQYDALIALGVVIKGETAHFDYVAGESSSGIARVASDDGIPVGFGLLTVLSEEQALARAGGAAGNKGEEAAAAALEMIYRLDEV
ncbi:MAG: 6,7-dimethyl-8-ribityllumazine synthase [bacterium]|nr:6,7-dimethyl-8-ribityllumazine synthase [bacterium]